MELAAGLLIIIISILHIVYGEKQSIAALSKLTDDSILIGSVRVMSLQGGILLFCVGMIHILSFLNVITLTGVALFFPLGIVSINLLTFLMVALLKHRKLFSIIVFQSIVFTIIIVRQGFLYQFLYTNESTCTRIPNHDFSLLSLIFLLDFLMIIIILKNSVFK